ncbi:MAG: DUF481 domain-containing protein, partial [Acidobacteriota bacterium]
MMKKACQAALLLSAFAGAILAQTPECPCPVPPPGPPPPWTGSAEFSYLSTSGNSTTSSLGGGLQLFYKPLPWTIGLDVHYLHSSADHVETSEQFKGALKGTRDLTAEIDVYARGSYLRDTFAGLDSLVSIDGGAGYKLLKGPVHLLRAEAGFGYSWENQVPTGIDRNYANARFGLGYKWVFSKTAQFSNDFGVLLDLADTNNWIINDT